MNIFCLHSSQHHSPNHGPSAAASGRRYGAGRLLQRALQPRSGGAAVQTLRWPAHVRQPNCAQRGDDSTHRGVWVSAQPRKLATAESNYSSLVLLAYCSNVYVLAVYSLYVCSSTVWQCVCISCGYCLCVQAQRVPDSDGDRGAGVLLLLPASLQQLRVSGNTLRTKQQLQSPSLPPSLHNSQAAVCPQCCV